MSELTPTEIAKIADRGALAAIVVDGDANTVSASNDNSICELLSKSPEFSESCAKFCGNARAFAEGAGRYRCHAGLDCTVVKLKSEKPLIAIVGRAFTSAEAYRRATERAIAGDWRGFPPTKFFENVLLTSSTENIDAAAQKIAALGTYEVPAVPESETPETSDVADAATETPETSEKELLEAAPIPKPTVEPSAPEIDPKASIDELIREFNERPPEIAAIPGPPSSEAEELAAWRSFFGSLASLKYRDACESILEFLQRRYGLSDVGWLELRDGGFEVIAASGALAGQNFRINFGGDDRRLFEAIETETPLRLRERTRAGERTERSVYLFPIAVGDEVQNALVVSDSVEDPTLASHLSRFCHSVAAEIEILRLREEVRRRGQMAKAVERFNASLKMLDTDDFWPRLLQISAELMNSERSSLLLFDEKNNRLAVRAAIGATADNIASMTEGIGERVARSVLTEGRPAVVNDIAASAVGAAPIEWKYKTGSYICYPFVIGDRRIGVLNVADKADGSQFSDFDLRILESIAPQVAVVIDRATLKEKAGAFEQLSVTDPLTGLLNRRYLEERLAEEVKRSNRYGYPMSFLMIDVDDFGKFNKDFGVLTGDRALRETVRAIRGTLRGADIAARYGGEEFCILLPQTTLAEARTIAERIRHSVESIEFPERRITISVGISAFGYGAATAEDVIRAADSAMRQAKAGGKNRVEVDAAAEASTN